MLKRTISIALTLVMLVSLFGVLAVPVGAETGGAEQMTRGEDAPAGQSPSVPVRDGEDDEVESPEDIDVYFVDQTKTETPHAYYYIPDSEDTSQDLYYPGDDLTELEEQYKGVDKDGNRYYLLTISTSMGTVVRFNDGDGQLTEAVPSYNSTVDLNFTVDAKKDDLVLEGNRFVVYKIGRADNSFLAYEIVDDVWPEPPAEKVEPTCTQDGYKIYKGLRTGEPTQPIQIPATGHSVDPYNYIGHNMHTGTCSICGESVTEPCDYDANNVCKKCGHVKETLEDGFYLIGRYGWDANALDSTDKFEANPYADGEHMLTTNLTVGDEIKVVKVTNNEIERWYPDPGDNYKVDAAHAGEKTIYFKSTYDSAWSEFGGHIWIEPNPEPSDPILDSNIQIYMNLQIGIELNTTLTVPVTYLNNNYTSWYMEVSKVSPDDGSITTTVFDPATDDNLPGNTNVVQFIYKGIAAKELGSTMRITVYGLAFPAFSFIQRAS